MQEDRVKWIEYNGKKILQIDYNDITPEMLSDIFSKITSVVSKEPRGSVLYISMCERVHFSTKMLSMFNKQAEATQPYDKASAILGVQGLVKVMYDAYAKLSKIQLKTFNKREEALEWLASV